MLRDRFEKELSEADAATPRLDDPRPSQAEIVRALELLSSAGDRFKQGDSEIRRELVQIRIFELQFRRQNGSSSPTK